MEATILLTMVLTTLLLFLFLRATFHRGQKYNLPPGPKPWPVIGNFDLIGALPHRSIHELSKKYGPLMHLRFGSFPLIIGSSVDMARYFLKTQDILYVDRPKTASGKYTTYNYADMTWSPYGAYWRQARRICLTQLFNPRRLALLEHIRADEVKALMCDLFAVSGHAVHLSRDHMSMVSMNVITRMVMGKRLFVDGVAEGPVPSLKVFRWMLDELFLLNGVLNIGDWIPWLDWMDLQGYVRRMKKIGKLFDAFNEHVLDEHSGERGRGEGEAARDMGGVLMEKANDNALEVQYGRIGVKAFTQDLIAGGTESSAVTVEWAMSELMRRPATFDVATEELDRVVGRARWVTEKDMPNLPYIEAIVKESMRMHPIVPLLTPRLAREDATIDGYDIPKGARVLINVWAIGRDPELWDAPEEFKPERFLGSKMGVIGQDLELLPFGSGRRMCPGYNLGLKVVHLSLANLLHGFTWRLPEGVRKEDLSMEEVFGLSTGRKYPLQVVAKPKLPNHLYV
uniref:Flavonoid 3'-monooxygenase n=1 Tax=Aegilops tauschii TaxID=37682 RepID=M8B769_AEGTA